MERRDSPGFWGLIPPRTRKTKEVPRRSASGRKPQVNKGSVLLNPVTDGNRCAVAPNLRP